MGSNMKVSITGMGYLIAQMPRCRYEPPEKPREPASKFGRVYGD